MIALAAVVVARVDADYARVFWQQSRTQLLEEIDTRMDAINK